jgi:hypothetical protein
VSHFNFLSATLELETEKLRGALEAARLLLFGEKASVNEKIET